MKKLLLSLFAAFAFALMLVPTTWAVQDNAQVDAGAVVAMSVPVLPTTAQGSERIGSAAPADFHITMKLEGTAAPILARAGNFDTGDPINHDSA